MGVAAPSASAEESPPGCTVDGHHLDLDGGFTVQRNGDAVPFTASISNDQPGACDITDATVTLEFPTPAGTTGGQQITLADDLDLPAGTSTITFPTQNYTVNFDDGVFKGPVTLALSGTRHFEPEVTGFIGSLSRNLFISRPHVTLSITPNPASGDAPLGVTYTYSALNDSPDNPDDTVTPDVLEPAISDDLCSPVTPTGGDTNTNSVLDDGETWTFTCSRTFPGGVFTNHASLSGSSNRDGRPWPETIAESTVTVNGPDMTLAKSHPGNFKQGETGAVYTITATNSGNQPSTGVVSVTDTLPAGLTATAMAGTGWSCDLPTLTCTRSDELAAGAAYPAIALTVNVAANVPGNVVNTATVSRAGENTANDTASDPTTINSAPGVGGPGGGGGAKGGKPRVLRCDGVRVTKRGTAGADRLRGTRRRDVIAGVGGNDVIRGLAGGDLICGGRGNDRLLGNRGGDTLFGGRGRDRLRGGTGRDRLFGGPSRDVLRGGPGRDLLRGGPGVDFQRQ
jgi:uncharacterized repeat protein (TIGR01451 family)